MEYVVNGQGLVSTLRALNRELVQKRELPRISSRVDHTILPLEYQFKVVDADEKLHPGEPSQDPQEAYKSALETMGVPHFDMKPYRTHLTVKVLQKTSLLLPPGTSIRTSL